MPILKPEIQRALRAAGLAKNENDTSLGDRLELVGLGVSETLERLADLVNNSTNEVVRRQALDTAFKLHGLLKDQAAPPPSVTIIINDPQAKTSEVNPILFPREISSQSSKKETIQ